MQLDPVFIRTLESGDVALALSPLVCYVEIHYLCRFREGTDSLVTLTTEYYYLELSTLSRPASPTPL